MQTRRPASRAALVLVVRSGHEIIGDRWLPRPMEGVA